LKKFTRSLTAIVSPPIHSIPQQSGSSSFAEEGVRRRKNISEQRLRWRETPWSGDSSNNALRRAKVNDLRL
jgi:hypothetical protein